MDEGNKNFSVSKRSRVEQALRRKILHRFLWSAVVLVILAVLIIIAFKALQRKEANLPGILVSDQGREHIVPGATHPSSNSNPPTSGWHYPYPAPWGVYNKEVPDEVLIHNLEHGGIWISYKPGVSGDIRTGLESFYKKWGDKIIVEPRAQNDSDIALAAWDHLDKFGTHEYSPERVDRFIRAFRNKGPEFVP